MISFLSTGVNKFSPIVRLFITKQFLGSHLKLATFQCIRFLHGQVHQFFVFILCCNANSVYRASITINTFYNSQFLKSLIHSIVKIRNLRIRKQFICKCQKIVLLKCKFVFVLFLTHYTFKGLSRSTRNFIN